MKSATSSTFERLRRAAARGILYAWVLVAVEFIVLGVFFRERFTSVWEITVGFLGHAPAWMLLAALPGAAGGAAGALVLTRQTRRQAASSRLGLSGGAFLYGATVAWAVGGGRHLADWGVRGGFAVVVGSLGAALVWTVLPTIRRLAVRPDSRRWLIVGGALLLVLCELCNQYLLVRLYPAFHGGLSVLALALAGGLGIFVEGGTARFGRRRKWMVLAASAIASLMLLPGSRAVVGFDNFRWLVSEHSPTLSWGVRTAALLAPPPPLDEELAALPLGARRPAQDVDFRGRDILLISIDALRADHLRSYGYSRDVSPAMDALARQGVRFAAAYAPTPHTSYSVTSLMTGKYMRPLLLQESGADSDLFASLLRDYGYRTAAFYPPAVFYIDTPRFLPFQEQNLAFEYAKVEFAEGDKRVAQIAGYLEGVSQKKNVFLWVHLFGPHEPYELHSPHDYGPRDIDLYDSEIRAADETVGKVVALVRERDPDALVLLTADHGEEFGDHGGRYHGTSVYDEQVRVPLLVAGAGVSKGKVVRQPVQTIDLLPTVLSGLDVPIPPRIRGRDLTKLLSPSEQEPQQAPGRAVAETDDYTLLAEGNHRLICHRRSGACQLFDIHKDPSQSDDLSATRPQVTQRMRDVARSIAESHGKFESDGLRAEGQGWPAAILLGLSGNADVAPELARLLDDADTAIRRKAAELLFTLGTTAESPALRLALTREEDEQARAFIALSLTSMGQGAPLVFELLREGDLRMKRLAALALSEQGDDTGQDVLLRWWLDRKDLSHQQAQRLLVALGNIESKSAVPHLVRSLDDVRLRPLIAQTLATIGDRDAKPFLARQLLEERYQSARGPLARALLELGADDELIVPLRRFLGVPDPIEDGLWIAQQAGILDDVGGPERDDLAKLKQLSDSGVRLSVIVPIAPKSERDLGVRLIVRARSRSGRGGAIYVEPAAPLPPKKEGQLRPRHQPTIDQESALVLEVPAADDLPPEYPAAQEGTPEERWHEVHVVLPERFSAKPGHFLGLEVFAPQDIELEALAAVPLRRDLPPPAPEPWKKAENSKEASPEDG